MLALRCRGAQRSWHVSSQFNFTPQVGVGLRYRIGERSALSLEYRFAHISDGGITERNGGINSHLVLIGFSIFR